MNILGILITVAFLLWMPLSLIILWLIYRGQQALMRETLVAVAEKVADNTRYLSKTSKRVTTLEQQHDKTSSESDAEPL